MIRIFVLVLIFALILFQFPVLAYYPPSELNGGWRKITDPAKVQLFGLDPEKLEEFGRYNMSIESGSGVKGCIVIKNGYIVGEWYNKEEAKIYQNYISSNGKAWAILLFGIIVEESRKGKLPISIDIDSKVYDKRWLPEGFPLSDPRKEQITFDQIFRHTSGILPESAGDTRWGEDWDFRYYTVGKDPDYPESASLYFDPGTNYDYSSVSFNHLSLFIRNITGMKSSEFLWDRILEPIGFGSVSYWEHQGMGDYDWAPSGQTGPKMTTRDYARLAYLLLRNGEWEDKQIFPSWYLDIFKKSADYPNILSNIDGYFGEQYPSDMFRVAGSGLNWAYIIPSMDLIAIRTSRASNSLWDEVRSNFLKKLFDAAIDNPYKKSLKDSTGESSEGEPLTGQIIVDTEHPQWLKYNDGRPFFMCGPGDPEDFLYRGIRNEDGTRTGDQMQLINKLDGTDANCIYLMAVRSHGGDGDSTHNPFINSNPKKGLDQNTLNQWENWFTEMDNMGIVIYFFFYDDDVSIWSLDNNGELSSEEKNFIQFLVNRFEHHKNLIWCVAEEYQEMDNDYLNPQPKQHVRKIAEAIREADNYKHVIAVHQLNGLDFNFPDDPNIDQFAIQFRGTVHELHDGLVKVWKDAAGRYNLNMSEPHDYGTGAEARKKSWACAMGGAYVMILGMDIDNTSVSDLKDCGYLVTFMESTDFNVMAPHDELAFGGTEYVLAFPGDSYIAYSSNLSGDIGLKNMDAGIYNLRWYDPTNGEAFEQAGIRVEEGNQTWKKLTNIGKEVAVYIKRVTDNK